MAWVCPSCGFTENEDEILRCVCGYELSPPEEHNDYSRLGGGLILVAFGLVLTSLINAVLSFISLGEAPEITPSVITVVGIVVPLYVVAPLILLVFLLRRKRFLPKLIISFYVLCLCFALLNYAVVRLLPAMPGFSKVIFTTKISILTSVVVCVIWVPYFLISERVKKTFNE